MSGALYGRALGVGLLSIWKSIEGTDYPVNSIWDWMDPGVISVIGSASMLGGVTRLGITTTVLMVRCPVKYSHSYYLIFMEQKCPFVSHGNASLYRTVDAWQKWLSV